jgi:hypothetical protein
LVVGCSALVAAAPQKHARVGGRVTPEFNVLVHALGSIGVFVLLLVPSLERWVNGHVLAGG